MRTQVVSHRPGEGWSQPLLPFDPTRSIALCFGAPEYADDPAPITELASTGIPVLGCSTAGEIHGTQIGDQSLSVAIAEFDRTPMRTIAASVTADTSFDAGAHIAAALAGPDLRGVIVLSEGLDVNGSTLVAGIRSQLGGDVVVTGGLAADGPRFERTWVVVDGRPTPGYVTAVGFYGSSIRLGHGSKGGWDIFGPERVVTRSENNVLYELDGRPVLGLYKEYLGELAAELPASGLLFPLSVRAPESDIQLVRTLLGVDEASQSLVFAGDIPTGHHVQLMQANFDRLIDGAEDAASEAGRRVGEGASLSLAISCVGRRLVLGERTEDELEATMHALPDGIAQVGFYSYGEISPYAAGACDLHNQTMTLTTIGEAA